MTDKARPAARDRQTTERAAEREFEQIFLEHWPAVYRLLARLMGDGDEAEDLALETFWRLHLHPPSQGRASNLGGWLYRVATNLGLNALRARQRRTRRELAAGQETLQAPAADDAIERIHSAEERAQVRLALSRMEERQAQLLLLRYSGLDYRELATALGVSPNSIGSLLVRAEREFEKRYKET